MFLADMASQSNTELFNLIYMPSSIYFGILLILVRLALSEILGWTQHYLAAFTNINAMQTFLQNNYNLDIEKKGSDYRENSMKWLTVDSKAFGTLTLSWLSLLSDVILLASYFLFFIFYIGTEVIMLAILPVLIMFVITKIFSNLATGLGKKKHSIELSLIKRLNSYYNVVIEIQLSNKNDEVFADFKKNLIKWAKAATKMGVNSIRTRLYTETAVLLFCIVIFSYISDIDSDELIQFGAVSGYLILRIIPILNRISFSTYQIKANDYIWDTNWND